MSDECVCPRSALSDSVFSLTAGFQDGSDCGPWNDLPPLPEADPLNPFPEYGSPPARGNSLRLVDGITRSPVSTNATAQLTSDSVGAAGTTGNSRAAVPPSSSSAPQPPGTGVAGGISQSALSPAAGPGSAGTAASPGSPKLVSVSTDVAMPGSSSGGSGSGGNLPPNDMSPSAQATKVSGTESTLTGQSAGASGSAVGSTQTSGGGVFPAVAVTTEEGERIKSGTRSEHAAEDERRGEQSRENAAEDPENFDPLEGEAWRC